MNRGVKILIGIEGGAVVGGPDRRDGVHTAVCAGSLVWARTAIRGNGRT